MHISRASLELFLDSKLPEDQLRPAVDHLRWCDACILRLSSLMQERKLRPEKLASEPPPAPEAVHVQVLQPDHARVVALIVERSGNGVTLHVEAGVPVGVLVQLRTASEIMMGYVVHCYEAGTQKRALVRIHDRMDHPRRGE